MVRILTKVILGLVGLAVLGGVAYLAVQWMSPDQAAPGGQSITSGGTTYQESSYSIEPAPELPNTRPIATGPIRKLKDEGFLLTRSESFVKIDSSGMAVGDSRDMEKAMKDPANDQEVIVTASTKIYLDVTDLEKSGNGDTVQENVKLITFDEIEKGGSVRVWGEKRGDRIIADVILYKKY